MKKALSFFLAMLMLVSTVFIANASENTFDVDSILDGKVYFDNEKYLIVINAITVHSDVITDCFAEYGINATLADENGNEIEPRNLATGLVFKTDGIPYNVILKGDTDGSGVIDSTDYLRLKKVFYKTIEYPQGAYFSASDVDGNGTIDSTDYLMIKKIFLKTYDFDISDSPDVYLAGTYDVEIWVSELIGVREQTQNQINDFMEKYPNIKINATISGVTENSASSAIIRDIESAPDIYSFYQDQIERLAFAGALSAPDRETAQKIIANNDEGSIKASTTDDGILYAYPMTSDNGYYMYYDKSIISEEDAKSMEKLIAACEANNKKFRFALENAWYTASFFFATGCTSKWGTDQDGNFVYVEDTFNSENGLIAMKGMQKLTNSVAYDGNADYFGDAGVIVTGLWNHESAEIHFGENFAAAELPSFEVDGKSYHLGSFSGYKLMGVKPQADPKKEAVLSLLAQYLTGEKCQLERYESFGWGPSNKAAQESEAVKSNASLSALLAQSKYSVPQGNIHGSWWDFAKQLGYEARVAESYKELEIALEEYQKELHNIFEKEEKEKIFTVIGSICGTLWDTDFPMAKVSENTWESNVLTLNVWEEFKVRYDSAWDINFGVEFNGANIVVEETGKYIVRLVLYGETDGQVFLIPAE